MRESDLIVPLGIAGILAGLKGVQNRQMSEVERLNQIALQSQEEEEDKSPEPEITDRTVFDEEGKLAMDLGVYGAPETFLVDKEGVIRIRHVGVLSPEVWKEKFEKVLRELND